MTVEEFAKKLSIALRNEAEMIARKVKTNDSIGFNALLDTAVASALISVSESVLDAAIDDISKPKRGFNLK